MLLREREVIIDGLTLKLNSQELQMFKQGEAILSHRHAGKAWYASHLVQYSQLLI